MRKTLKILILKILDKEGKKVKIVSLFNNKGGVGKRQKLSIQSSPVKKIQNI